MEFTKAFFRYKLKQLFQKGRKPQRHTRELDNGNAKGSLTRERSITPKPSGSTRAKADLEQALTASLEAANEISAAHTSPSQQTTPLQESEALESPPKTTDQASAAPMGEEAPETQGGIHVYLRFNSEEDEDYTYGPTYMVHASDGIKDDCTAMLLNRDLSEKMQTALLGQRSLQKYAYEVEAKNEAHANFIAELNHQIRNHEYRLDMLENRPSDPNKGLLVPSSPGYPEEAKLRDEIYKLQILVEKTEVARSELEVQMGMRTRAFLNRTADVYAYLEDALINAALLPAEEEQPDIEIEEMDIDTEYQKLCEQMHPASDFESLTHCNDLHEATQPREMNDEQQRNWDLSVSYNNAWDALRIAQNEFDGRENAREEARHYNNRALQNGEPLAADTIETPLQPDDFDILWVQEYRYLTHALIAAEERFTAARNEATQAGIDLGVDDDQSEGFYEDDGAYPASQEERAVQHTKDSSKVQDWVKSVEGGVFGYPSMVSAGEEVRGDEWKAREVEVGDSYSCAAVGKLRGRIRRWREICGM